MYFIHQYIIHVLCHQSLLDPQLHRSLPAVLCQHSQRELS